MRSILIKNDFTISFGELSHEHYLKLVEYLVKQRANGKISFVGAHNYDQEGEIFNFEVGSVSNLPPVYHGIKISVVSNKIFEKGKVGEAVHGLVELLATFEKE